MLGWLPNNTRWTGQRCPPHAESPVPSHLQGWEPRPCTADFCPNLPRFVPGPGVLPRALLLDTERSSPSAIPPKITVTSLVQSYPNHLPAPPARAMSGRILLLLCVQQPEQMPRYGQQRYRVRVGDVQGAGLHRTKDSKRSKRARCQPLPNLREVAVSEQREVHQGFHYGSELKKGDPASQSSEGGLCQGFRQMPGAMPPPLTH